MKQKDQFMYYLNKHLKDLATWEEPQAGMFVWIKLNKVDNTDSNATNGMIERNYSGKTMAKADGADIKEQEIRERLNFVMGKQADKVNLEELQEEQLTAIATEVAVQRKVLQVSHL